MFYVYNHMSKLGLKLVLQLSVYVIVRSFFVAYTNSTVQTLNSCDRCVNLFFITILFFLFLVHVLLFRNLTQEY